MLSIHASSVLIGLTWVAYTICGLIVVGVMIELMKKKGN